MDGDEFSDASPAPLPFVQMTDLDYVIDTFSAVWALHSFAIIFSLSIICCPLCIAVCYVGDPSNMRGMDEQLAYESKAKAKAKTRRTKWD